MDDDWEQENFDLDALASAPAHLSVASPSANVGADEDDWENAANEDVPAARSAQDEVEDWEREDFDIPNPVATVNTKLRWDDEDQVDVSKLSVSAGPTDAAKEARRKKIEQEEIELANKLKFELEAGESEQQRRQRLRQEQDEANQAQVDDLFGSVDSRGRASASAGDSTATIGVTTIKLAEFTLRTKVDHSNLGHACAATVRRGDSESVSKYYVGVTNKLKDTMVGESVEEVLNVLIAERDKRKREVSRAAAARAPVGITVVTGISIPKKASASPAVSSSVQSAPVVANPVAASEPARAPLPPPPPTHVIDEDDFM